MRDGAEFVAWVARTLTEHDRRIRAKTAGGGATGPAGPTGPQGPVGPPGATGATGALGGTLVQSIAVPGSSFAVPNDGTYRRPTHLAAITFTSPSTSAVYRLSYSLDVQTLTNNGFIVASFYIDGTIVGVPAGVVQSPGATIRTALTKELRVTGLSAGSHTVEVRVTTQTTGTATVFEHSTLHLQQIT